MVEGAEEEGEDGNFSRGACDCKESLTETTEPH